MQKKYIKQRYLKGKFIKLVSGQMNAVGIASMAALTGIEIAVIIVAVSVGIGLIISLWKGYEIVDFEVDSQPPRAKFKVKR